MPTILLTRPYQDSEKLAARLAERGYATHIEPLLTIAPISSPAPDLTGLQATMATSAHAFTYLDKELCENSGLFDLPCYCVGANTAAAALDAGFSFVHDASGDGYILAGQMQAMLDPSDGAILHFAARDTDGRARGMLEKSNFTLRPWILYAAETAGELSPAAIDLLRAKKLDAVLLFSTRTAETLKNLLQSHGLESCCENVIALALSDAVRAALGPLPWRRLDAAAEPREDSILDCLQKHLPHAEAP